MNPSKSTDVLVVGAGPTGLSMACQLARLGVDFIVLEKREGVTTYSKALGVQARTLEIYEQIGLAAPAVEQGTIASKLRLIEGGTVRGELNLSSVGEGQSPYPFMLVLEQSRNEQMLYDYLKSQGGDVVWNAELKSFTQHEEGVTAEAIDSAGEAQTIEAKYVVGCDGPRSIVRHGLNIGFEGSTFERLFYVADVHIEWQFPHDALNVCMATNSVVAFFPMKGENRYRIVGAFPEGVDKEEGEVLYSEIEQRIKLEANIPLTISHVNWFSTYKVHSRHASRFIDGRCFLAGDAAHVHTPAGGQGMNTGIQDAYNLAWKLAHVIRHGSNPSFLDTYETERLQNAKNLLKTTDRMFTLAAGSDWLEHLVRSTLLPPLAGMMLRVDPIRKRFFSLISQIGIEYHQSALSDAFGDHDFAIRAGTRMPYFLSGGVSVYDRIRAPKFHLLSFNDSLALAPLEARFAEVVETVALPLDDAAKAAFGVDSAFTVLLRPDNYIALLALGDGASAVNHYLTLLLED